MPRLFFTSYAHVNRDRFLVKFIERLRDEVLQRGPGGLGPDDVVFFDSEGIQTGEQWVKKLSAAVSECKVCVAICSPAYISSDFCGKEIRVFLGRLQEWEKRPENAGTSCRSIIPIIWVKTTLPDVLNAFQYDEKKLPREYTELGLRTLCQLNRYKDKRQEIEITLAECIVAAAKSNLPVGGTIPHFDHISSAFTEQREGARYGIALVSLAKGDVNFTPYEQGRTLRNLMDEACAPRIPWRALTQDGKLKRHLRDAKKNREAILIVADLETLKDPLYQQVIAAIDATVGDQSALLVIRPDRRILSAEQEASVEITLRGFFPNALAKFWHADWSSIRSIEALPKGLEETITKLRNRLISEDPAQEATDKDISAAAVDAGVPIERQPMITGPGEKE